MTGHTHTHVVPGVRKVDPILQMRKLRLKDTQGGSRLALAQAVLTGRTQGQAGGTGEFHRNAGRLWHRTVIEQAPRPAQTASHCVLTPGLEGLLHAPGNRGLEGLPHAPGMRAGRLRSEVTVSTNFGGGGSPGLCGSQTDLGVNPGSSPWCQGDHGHRVLLFGTRCSRQSPRASVGCGQ